MNQPMQSRPSLTVQQCQIELLAPPLRTRMVTALASGDDEYQSLYRAEPGGYIVAMELRGLLTLVISSASLESSDTHYH